MKTGDVLWLISSEHQPRATILEIDPATGNCRVQYKDPEFSGEFIIRWVMPHELSTKRRTQPYLEVIARPDAY